MIAFVWLLGLYVTVFTDIEINGLAVIRRSSFVDISSRYFLLMVDFYNGYTSLEDTFKFDTSILLTLTRPTYIHIYDDI